MYSYIIYIPFIHWPLYTWNCMWGGQKLDMGTKSPKILRQALGEVKKSGTWQMNTTFTTLFYNFDIYTIHIYIYICMFYIHYTYTYILRSSPVLVCTIFSLVSLQHLCSHIFSFLICFSWLRNPILLLM